MSNNKHNFDNVDSRRMDRRKRRIRNQWMAYIFTILFMVAIGFGIYYGVGYLKSIVGNPISDFLATPTPAPTPIIEDVVDVAPSPEPSEEPVIETSPEELLEQAVDEIISGMTLEDKISGLFIVTPEAITGVDTAIKAGDGTKDALQKYPVGGLIYSSKNIKSEDQIHEMVTNTIAVAKYPLFITSEEEGGKNVALTNVVAGGETIDSATKIGATGDPMMARTAMTLIGGYMYGHGFNLNLAPLAEVAREGGDIGERSYGSDVDIVSAMISSAVEGLESSSVSACVKYFPGGDIKGDTKDKSLSDDISVDDMKTNLLPPFASAIAAGTDAIMVGHIVYPNVSTDNMPASMSSYIIGDILRKELGYNGIVITDAMNKKAIKDYYTSGEAAISALKAGADMVMIPEKYEEAYTEVIEAVKSGVISEDRINDSLMRIYKVKYRGKLEQQ